MNRKLDKMEQLLANKNYGDLLPEEKAWIDQQFTAEEYLGMRATFLKSTQLLRQNKTRPNPEIKSRLRQKLRESQKAESAKITPLFSHRIPAWQAVAAVALLLFFIPQLQNQKTADPEKVFIYQTDTVFKEVPSESILNNIVDTLTDIPQIRKVLNRTNRSPIKASTVVFSKDSSLSVNLSQDVSAYFANQYDTSSVDQMINRYLKDSVKSYRVDVDSGFQDMGRVY